MSYDFKVGDIVGIACEDGAIIGRILALDEEHCSASVYVTHDTLLCNKDDGRQYDSWVGRTEEFRCKSLEHYTEADIVLALIVS